MKRKRKKNDKQKAARHVGVDRIDKVIDETVRTVPTKFQTYGRIWPHAIVIAEDGECLIVSPAQIREGNIEDKDYWANAIATTAGSVRAVAVLLVTEAWFPNANADPNDPRRLSQQPDREEGVVLNFETRTQAGAFVWRIDRTGAVPRLCDRARHEGFSGRLAGFLHRPNVDLN